MARKLAAPCDRKSTLALNGNSRIERRYYRLSISRIGLIECRYQPHWRSMMNQTANRPLATLLAAAVAAALWLPTVTVPTATPTFAAAPVAVELA
jgi:hypothetical protein